MLLLMLILLGKMKCMSWYHTFKESNIKERKTLQMFTMSYVRKFLADLENLNQYIEEATQGVMFTWEPETRI